MSFEETKLKGKIKLIGYTVMFISFIVAVLSMPYIKSFIAKYTPNIIFQVAGEYLIAFILAIIILPKIVGSIMGRMV